MSTKIVDQLLKELGQTEVYSVSSESTAYAASNLMGDKNVGALVVMDNGKLVGIISERDINRKVSALDFRSTQVRVADIMTKKVQAVGLQTNLEECEDLMKEWNVRHLPVVDKGKVVGMISIRDLMVSTRQEEMQFRQHLEEYLRHP